MDFSVILLFGVLGLVFLSVRAGIIDLGVFVRDFVV